MPDGVVVHENGFSVWSQSRFATKPRGKRIRVLFYISPSASHFLPPTLRVSPAATPWIRGIVQLPVPFLRVPQTGGGKVVTIIFRLCPKACISLSRVLIHPRTLMFPRFTSFSSKTRISIDNLVFLSRKNQKKKQLSNNKKIFDCFSVCFYFQFSEIFFSFIFFDDISGRG